VYQVMKFMNPENLGGYNGLFGLMITGTEIGDWDSYYACLYGHYMSLRGIALPIKLDPARKRVVFDQFSGKAARSFAAMWDQNSKPGDVVSFYMAKISQSGSQVLAVYDKEPEACFEYTQE